MKALFSGWRWLAGALPALAASAALAAPAAQLNLPDFDALSSRATETVNISLDTALLGLAASFLDAANPDDAATKELIAGLKGIYVRSYTFGQDFAYPAAQVDLVRKQLAPPAWQRLLEVNSTRDHTHVQIYVCVDRGVANGLAIIASEPREFTIVNIVGSIDLARLRRLEGRFGIPKLDLSGGSDGRTEGGKDDRPQAK